eukprot:CAMPEP_0115180082 /NCGR_PEP_ID=MMETSP0270-20121206/6738_1 /TAXON_ID=71861 /ORGANISM="Scrippsiella trochoidea, Strain CCMP3099" /LENGTH=43 /DNA_ID= /DNA_START= /DNA_END= /DNA_ORIENTATION=
MIGTTSCWHLRSKAALQGSNLRLKNSASVDDRFCPLRIFDAAS